MREQLLITIMVLILVPMFKLVPLLLNRRAVCAFLLFLTSGMYFLAWYLKAAELPVAVDVAIRLLIIAQPVFFWLTCNVFFDDRFLLRWWHTLFISGKFLLAVVIFHTGTAPNIFAINSAETQLRLLPGFLYSLAFVSHAIFVIVSTNPSDLNEPRRKLRRTFLVATGLLTIFTILSAAILRPLGWGASGDTAGLIVVLLLQIAFLAWGDQSWMDFLKRVRETQRLTDIEDELMQKAVNAMENDEAFRTLGLTVGALAGRLDTQEYKLRRAINAGLGYQNFNEFLNFYRIKAAKQFLVSAEKPDYPIIHLAFDLGYPSPSPFNRAFRDATGMSPTEYKKRNAKMPPEKAA